MATESRHVQAITRLLHRGESSVPVLDSALSNRSAGRGLPLQLGWPRLLLVLACAAACVAAPVVAAQQASTVQDADLSFLLRFMGAVKLALVLAVGAGAWWRLGGPFPTPWLAVAYSGAVALMLLAGLLIVQLSHLPQAAAVFHASAFCLICLAVQDRNLPGMLIR